MKTIKFYLRAVLLVPMVLIWTFICLIWFMFTAKYEDQPLFEWYEEKFGRKAKTI